MVMMPEENNKEFEVCPETTALAVCYQVIDLGTQETTYDGVVNHKRQVRISWELPDELMSDGRPFMVSQKYTLSSSEKSKLRKHLEAWRGRKFTKEELGNFDIGNLIGATCMLQIVHNEASNGNVYANIASIMKPMKGQATKEQPKNEPLHFDLDSFNAEVYSKLSDYLKETIAKSPEYQAVKENLSAPASPFDAGDDVAEMAF